jgi:hypothetical protein
MGWATALTTLMHRNKLFNQTRFRLAGWYAVVMGGILGLAGFITYQRNFSPSQVPCMTVWSQS